VKETQSVELLNTPVTAVVLRRPWFSQIHTLTTENRAVSVIYYGVLGQSKLDTATRVKSIFEGTYYGTMHSTCDQEKPDNNDEVKKKWGIIIEFAKNYAYAEQQGFGGTFQHWPDSRYPSVNFIGGRNSNTFVLDALNAAGLNGQEMSGHHPGRRSQ
jgi:hypothetical protein